jgi:hypothetical protein
VESKDPYIHYYTLPTETQRHRMIATIKLVFLLYFDLLRTSVVSRFRPRIHNRKSHILSRFHWNPSRSVPILNKLFPPLSLPKFAPFETNSVHKRRGVRRHNALDPSPFAVSDFLSTSDLRLPTTCSSRPASDSRAPRARLPAHLPVTLTGSSKCLANA